MPVERRKVPGEGVHIRATTNPPECGDEVDAFCRLVGTQALPANPCPPSRKVRRQAPHRAAIDAAHRYGNPARLKAAAPNTASCLGRVMISSRIGLRVIRPTAMSRPTLRAPASRGMSGRRRREAIPAIRLCCSATPSARVLCARRKSCSPQIDFVGCQRDTECDGDMFASRWMSDLAGAFSNGMSTG